jgi:hypothetical protein
MHPITGQTYVTLTAVLGNPPSRNGRATFTAILHNLCDRIVTARIRQAMQARAY